MERFSLMLADNFSEFLISWGKIDLKAKTLNDSISSQIITLRKSEKDIQTSLVGHIQKILFYHIFTKATGNINWRILEYI